MFENKKPLPAACAADRGKACRAVDSDARHDAFARFRHLYESRDGGLCVFEDEHGHLVAVDASKLV